MPPFQSTVSREQRFKTDHRLANKIRNSIQHWQERCTLENPRFIQRYKKGELQVLLKFSTGFVPKEYVIVFERKPDINENHPRIRPLPLCEQFWEYARQVNSKVPANNCNWEPVFVDDTQAVQAPENISLPSLVWFNSADRIYSILPHALYFSKAVGFVVSGTRTRKLNPLTFAAICSTPESTCQIVQGASEILDGVSSDGGDHGIDWLHVRDAIRRAAICIHLADRFVWPTPYEFGDLDFKILDMMIGPFDLDAD